MKYLQEFYEASKFFCQLITVYVDHRELVSLLELPITFDERFKVTSVLFLIPDFNLLSC